MIKNFAEWCEDKGLAQIHQDGSVSWKEAIKPPTTGTMKDGVKGGKKISHKEKIDGPRALEDDLSDDYVGHYSHMGTVWPFKVVNKIEKAKGK